MTPLAALALLTQVLGDVSTALKIVQLAHQAGKGKLEPPEVMAVMKAVGRGPTATDPIAFLKDMPTTQE